MIKKLDSTGSQGVCKLGIEASPRNNETFVDEKSKYGKCYLMNIRMLRYTQCRNKAGNIFSYGCESAVKRGIDLMK